MFFNKLPGVVPSTSKPNQWPLRTFFGLRKKSLVKCGCAPHTLGCLLIECGWECSKYCLKKIRGALLLLPLFLLSLFHEILIYYWRIWLGSRICQCWPPPSAFVMLIHAALILSVTTKTDNWGMNLSLCRLFSLPPPPRPVPLSFTNYCFFYVLMMTWNQFHFT